MNIKAFFILLAVSLFGALGLYLYCVTQVAEVQQQLQETQDQLEQKTKLTQALGDAVTANESTIADLQQQLADNQAAARQQAEQDAQRASELAQWQQKNEELRHDQTVAPWAASPVPAAVGQLLLAARTHYRHQDQGDPALAAGEPAAALPDPGADQSPG